MAVMEVREKFDFLAWKSAMEILPMPYLLIWTVNITIPTATATMDPIRLKCYTNYIYVHVWYEYN